jgi:hypothetical protein
MSPASRRDFASDSNNFEVLSKPHKGFRRGVHRVRRRRKTRGEHSSSEKGPFPDGNQLGAYGRHHQIRLLKFTVAPQGLPDGYRTPPGLLALQFPNLRP